MGRKIWVLVLTGRLQVTQGHQRDTKSWHVFSETFILCSCMAKTQVLVSENWQIPTLFVPGFMLLLFLCSFHSLSIWAPGGLHWFFLVSSGMHLKEWLLVLSSISNCPAVGSLQVILSSVVPIFCRGEVFEIWCKGNRKRSTMDVLSYTFSRKCQTPWSPKSRSSRWGKFL